jgi:parallel beta-helix repeat protein
MIKKINMVLILLLLLIVSVGAVSAADDFNETLSTNDNAQDYGILTATQHTVTSSNYNQYFSSSGELIGSAVNDGDTLTLSGDFSGKDFIINKNITIAGSGGTIANGIVKLTKGASGSAVHDLKIRNSENFHQGIYLLGATNCEIYGNDIINKGQSSYAITLIEGADYNHIYNNQVQCQGSDYGHGTRSTSVVLFGRANNNILEYNDIKSDDANAIYLSSYAGGEFKGGESYNNIIRFNNIQYMVNVTSWAYGIQLMGGNNTVESNKINGAYRGVSSSNFPLNKIINNTIYVTGVDFSSGAFSGGDYGIALAANATVKDNTITGFFVGAGISVGDNSVVDNNFVNASKGYAVEATGDNVQIINNELYTVSSAAVHQQGKYEGIVVDRNMITSESGIGVLLSKSSKTKYPSNIKVTNNHIETSNTYMINAAEADKDSWVINNNTGTGKILTPSGEVDPSVPDFLFNGTVHNITPSNYHSFIDADGNLLNDVIHDGDILNFSGTFNNKQFCVSSSVKLTGPNPEFINSTICVTSDSVWIENLTIVNKNTSHNAWGIFVADTNVVKILNNDITVYDPTSAYAVYIYKSSKVYVENNKFTSHGTNLTYTLLGYGAEECEFKDNVVNCIGTGVLHPYEDPRDINGNASEICIGQCICLGDIVREHCLDGTNIVPELLRTYGILMIKSSNNTLTGNDVTVTSLVSEAFAANSTNSLVGIDFYYDCDNNLISNNKINVTGNDNYLYGAGAIAHPTGGSGTTALNNTFIDNEISVNGHYMAEGLVFGPGCTDTKAIGNTINLNAETVSYGVNLESSNNSTLDGNVIDMASDVAYGIEAFKSSGNLIENNVIAGEGKLVAGFAGTNTNNNVIQGNTITSKGGDSNANISRDSIKASNSGIYMDGASKGNLIDSNFIETQNGYPVDLSTDSTGNTITNNYLKGSEGSGDEGVNNSASNTVHDNYASSFDNVTMDDVVCEYNTQFTVTVSTDIAADGADVQFTLNGDVIGNATVNNGKASFTYDLNKSYPVNSYNLTARLTKSGFKSGEISANLEITKANVTITVDDVTAKKGQSVPISALVVDSADRPISGIEVKFSRNANYIGTATSDENGIANFVYKIPTSLNEGTYTIFATSSESNNYAQSIGQANLIVADAAVTFTKIEAKDISMYVKDGTRLAGTITDLDNNPIANVNVSISINGQTYTRTSDKDGHVSIALGLSAGTYNASFVFKGDSKYMASSANSTVTIKPTLTANDVEMMYKDGSRYYVAIIKDGKPVANVNVSLNINGVIYHRTTNAIGTASIAINLPAKTYIVTAERDDTHEKISNNITVKPLLVENKDVDMFFKNGTRYTVKVIKQDGSVAGAGEAVRFNINGVFYDRTTDKDGIAGLNLNLAPGDYIITAEYKGFMVSNNIHIKPILSASDLTKKYKTETPFTASVVDGQGKPLAGATIRFNINGVFYNRVSDSTGVARLNINLIAGEYIITSMYSNGATISNKVTITP